MTDKPAHRLYRGLADDAGTNPRIHVVAGGGGPTERGQATVLYELTPDTPFWWGYGGSSPGRAAAAIVDDVLPDVLPAEQLTSMPSSTRQDIIAAFLQDFLAHAHDQHEFWIPAQTVTRWLHGYFRELTSGV
ncbi:DUF6166 domain-containing protein [Bounagaea algeriensis]